MQTNPTVRIVIRYLASLIFGAAAVSALIALLTERAYAKAKAEGGEL